jgi:hypothetical protein
MKTELIKIHLGSAINISNLQNKIVQAQASTKLMLMLPSEKTDLATQIWAIAKMKLSLRSENQNEDMAQIVILTDDLELFGNLTKDEIMIGLKMGLNGEFLNKDQQVFFNSSNFVQWIRKYIERKQVELAELAKLPKMETIKPVPSDQELKMMAINNANDHADLMVKMGKDFKWIAGGLYQLYDDLVKFGLYQCPESDIIRIKAKNYVPFLSEIELNATYKSAYYKEFIQSMVNMDVRFDQSGQLF